MSEPKDEPIAHPEKNEERPGPSRWDTQPGDIVIHKRGGESVSGEESETHPPLTAEERESRSSKFTWELGDVVLDEDDEDLEGEQDTDV